MGVSSGGKIQASGKRATAKNFKVTFSLTSIDMPLNLYLIKLNLKHGIDK